MSQARADIAGLIQALEGPAPAAEAAGRELLVRCRNAPRPLVQALETTSVCIRRRVAFLLGKVRGGNERDELQDALIGALTDVDAKVRRNAAISLGSVAERTHAPLLKAAIGREDNAAVRASLMLAFGHVASDDDLPWVSAWVPATDRERRAADTVRARLLGRGVPAATLNTATRIAPNVPVELRTRRGLAELLVHEAQALGLCVRALDQERVAVLGGPSLASLLQPRIALYPVLTYELAVGADNPSIAGRLFAGSAAAQEMRRLTAGDTVVYRVTMRRAVKGFSRRREWIASFAGATAELVNRATGYSWEVIVEPLPTGMRFAVRPAAAPDRRFAYRHRDVPASLHPTLAAAAARALPFDARDVVLDPFCGSGTLLAERALRGPYARLLGIDHLATALDAARVNLDEVARVELRGEDFLAAERLGPVQQIITNPPYGRRVDSVDNARRLQRALDDLAVRILSPGGYLAVYRPRELPGPAQLRKVKRLHIDAGGLAVHLWIARKDP